MSQHPHKPVCMADGGGGFALVNGARGRRPQHRARARLLFAAFAAAGYAISLWKRISRKPHVAYLLVFALIMSIGGLLFWQAMSGRPLIALREGGDALYKRKSTLKIKER